MSTKRRRNGTAVTAALLGSSLALAACSSGSSGGGAGATAAKAPAALCQKLTGILADGPDPDADPVGYAFSQIEALHKLHSADSSVMTTVTGLVGADQKLVATNGRNKAAATAIKNDLARLNQACPGAAS